MTEGTGGTTAAHGVQCAAPSGCEPYFLGDGEGGISENLSGWLRCQDGAAIYRQAPVDCAAPVFWPQCQGGEGSCSVDADCGGVGSCVDVYGTCACVPQCMSDSECGEDELCLCAGATAGSFWIADHNTCIKATCRGAEGCEGVCGCHGSQNFCGELDSAYCHTDSDECGDHDDCQGGAGLCSWSGERWSCIEVGSCE